MRPHQRQWLLEDIRERHKDTQDDLAELLNINTTTYRRKEKGDAEFKASEMFLIAKYYGKKIDDIFLPTEFTERELNKQEV